MDLTLQCLKVSIISCMKKCGQAFSCMVTFLLQLVLEMENPSWFPCKEEDGHPRDEFI